MVKTEKTSGNVPKSNRANKEVIKRKEPRCLAIAKNEVRTSSDFSRMMSALMSDLIEDKITPKLANSVVNAGGKLLKVVELQLKYGSPKKEDSALNLITAS